MWTFMDIRSIPQRINVDIGSIPQRFSELSTVGKVSVGLLGVYSTYIGTQTLYGLYRRSNNNRIRRKKRQENAQSIQDLARRLKEDNLTEARVSYIIHLKLADLCKELREGKIRPVEALRAYQTKALDAHSKTNCLIEIITEADQWALELEKGPKDGALWGVPISIKDDVGLKGYDSAIGVVSRIGLPSPEDATMLKILRKAGAIPFVKTNVPQLEISLEPGNPINGVVHNPHRHGYGPGASSSGEGALIGSGGSILGIGSDLGGSIRIPAHFCGVFGFKPTAERTSSRDMGLDTKDVMPIRSTWGPLSREMDGLVSALKVLWEDGIMARADPDSVPLPFNSQVYSSTKKLRIGYYTNIDRVPTFTACVRAVEEAKRLLADLGHELVAWQPPDEDGNTEAMSRIAFADGGAGVRESLKYDILHPTAKPFALPAYIPVWMKKLLSYLLYPLDERISKGMIWSCGTGDIPTYYKAVDALRKQRRLVQDSWNEAGLDAVICPPNVMAAPPLGNTELLFATFTFTATYNMLHFPAGVLPFTAVKQSDVDNLNKDFPAGDRIRNLAKQAMAESLDLPVGVMVVAQKYEDEKCLRVMKILDDALKKQH